MWHTMRHNRAFRLGPFLANILRSIAEIAIKPVKGSTSNTVMRQFRYKDVMTDRVKGFR